VASPDDVAVQDNVVVEVKGPKVAGLAAVVALPPFTEQEIVAPEVEEETTGDIDPVNVSWPGENVGVAVVGVTAALLTVIVHGELPMPPVVD
jgi:hypothetical protein